MTDSIANVNTTFNVQVKSISMSIQINNNVIMAIRLQTGQQTGNEKCTVSASFSSAAKVNKINQNVCYSPWTVDTGAE